MKSEALIESPLEHSHDTRYKKKSERRLTITSTPLEQTNHARALTLLTKVSSPSKPHPTKKIKMRRTFRRLLQLRPIIKVSLSRDVPVTRWVPHATHVDKNVATILRRVYPHH